MLPVTRTPMQRNLYKRTVAASPRELDAKLELLQQLGYGDRFYLDEHEHAPDASIPDEKLPCLDRDTDRWIQTEYNWALEEAAESAASIPDLFDVEEDEEACLPYVYDPTFFAARQSLPSTPRSRSQSLSQGNVDKPLPSVPPLRIRNRPSLPIVPPPSPAVTSVLSSPASSPPVSPRSARCSPPPSPRLNKVRSSPRIPSAPAIRPSTHRHATYPSISSTLSLLEERESESEKRSAVYVADEEVALQRTVPKPMGRGRSSSATVPLSGTHPISASPKRKHRPALPALSTSASSPQLRRLAELAATPSPSFSIGSPLLPSPMSDMTVTPETETEVVTPGEAITFCPLEPPLEEDAAEPGLASRWSLDSVASRPRITQMALDDASSSSPASKTKKRDRLLSLISGRARSGSVTKPLPPPNTPRGSSDVLDIRRIDSRDAPSPSASASARPSFSMPPKISMTPSLSSSNSSNASTLATPIEPMHADPFAPAADSPSCMPEDIDEEESPVFAENPFYHPDSPLLPPTPDSQRGQPSPPPASLTPPAHAHAHEYGYAHGHEHEHLTLQIPERPMSPGSPPPQPTLPLPSPSTPSPSFLVPSPRPQSFFATITGRQRRRKKKLVISGAPLELGPSRSSSSVSGTSSDDYHHRMQEQRRRAQNVVRWCESFGPVKKVETKEDGSLHVYWRDWEVADMVCRVQAQVVIKDVGRVNLAWYYIS